MGIGRAREPFQSVFFARHRERGAMGASQAADAQRPENTRAYLRVRLAGHSPQFIYKGWWSRARSLLGTRARRDGSRDHALGSFSPFRPV
jgi:hypothetical protein